jgi:hypothetical protein
MQERFAQMIFTKLTIAFLLSTSPTFANTQCAALIQDLREMQIVQKQILASLLNNHESFASSLEEYSGIINKAKGSQVRQASGKMRLSAVSFRERGLQGKETVQKLNTASDKLLEQVRHCLKPQ